MQPPGNPNPQARRVDWPAIFRIFLMQVLVLLALSAAFIRYLDWSSDQAWAEFSRSGRSSPPTTIEPATPMQPAKAKATCTRGA